MARKPTLARAACRLRPRFVVSCAALFVTAAPWLSGCGDGRSSTSELDASSAPCAVTSSTPEVKCTGCSSVTEYTLRCADETSNPIDLAVTGSTVAIITTSNRAFYPLLLNTTSGRVSFASAHLARLWQLWLWAAERQRIHAPDAPHVVEQERGLAVEYQGRFIEIPETSPLPTDRVACFSTVWPVPEGSKHCEPVCTDRRRGVEPKTVSASIDSSGKLWLAWRYTTIDVTLEYEHQCGFDDCLCFARNVKNSSISAIHVAVVNLDESTVRHMIELPVRPDRLVWEITMFDDLDIHAFSDRLLLAHVEPSDTEYVVGDNNYRLRLHDLRW